MHRETVGGYEFLTMCDAGTGRMMRTERSKEYPTANLVSRRRVLIVDDMAQVRQDLRLLLELTGMIQVVAEAADGRQAIELAQVLRPDVVVMDLAMPVMDGFTATREIKERGSARRIVVLSVHGEAETLQLALEAGADALIVKGAPLETLVNAILITQD